MKSTKNKNIKAGLLVLILVSFAIFVFQVSIGKSQTGVITGTIVLHDAPGALPTYYAFSLPTTSCEIIVTGSNAGYQVFDLNDIEIASCSLCGHFKFTTTERLHYIKVRGAEYTHTINLPSNGGGTSTSASATYDYEEGIDVIYSGVSVQVNNCNDDYVDNFQVKCDDVCLYCQTGDLGASPSYTKRDISCDKIYVYVREYDSASSPAACSATVDLQVLFTIDYLSIAYVCS